MDELFDHTGVPAELLIFFAKSAQLHSAKTDETNFGGFGTIRMACFPVFKVPFTPDVVDAVDAGDVLQGVGTDGWRRVRRVRRVVWWLLVVVSGNREMGGTVLAGDSLASFAFTTPGGPSLLWCFTQSSFFIGRFAHFDIF